MIVITRLIPYGHKFAQEITVYVTFRDGSLKDTLKSGDQGILVNNTKKVLAT